MLGGLVTVPTSLVLSAVAIRRRAGTGYGAAGLVISGLVVAALVLSLFAALLLSLRR